MKEVDLISATENYVREIMFKQEGTMITAHDFKHVDRVRSWALIIAREEGFAELEIVEVTALLHDIGLAHISDRNENKNYVVLPPHGSLGAEIAARFLIDNSNLSKEDIERITDVIRYHSSPPSIVEEHLLALGEKGKLIEIIRDADNLDALGAVGLMRAFTSKHFLPEYDPQNIKGDTWALSPVEFRKRFGVDPKAGLAPVNTVIDQVNQQIRYYDDNLHTQTAQNLAKPLVQFMKDFVIQLEYEIAT